MIRRPPRSTLFPYTTALPIWREEYHDLDHERAAGLMAALGVGLLARRTFGTLSEGERKRVQIARALIDRKSTRLNSSHANISYAVFCLKKKPSHSYRCFVSSL